jgi:hypothetical protein
MIDSYRSPVTEVVPDEGEWKLLEYGERSIDASKLARWFRLVYPPGVNEQLHPYENVKGSLSLKPLDKARAILSGSVTLSRRGAEEHPFEGTIRALITYENDRPTLRGVIEGTYPRHDPMRDRWGEWKLVAAIESRPK